MSSFKLFSFSRLRQYPRKRRAPLLFANIDSDSGSDGHEGDKGNETTRRSVCSGSDLAANGKKKQQQQQQLTAVEKTAIPFTHIYHGPTFHTASLPLPFPPSPTPTATYVVQWNKARSMCPLVRTPNQCCVDNAIKQLSFDPTLQDV
ncbi:hypothetical protein FRC20_005929, partial [Serendipita sp. 405]